MENLPYLLKISEISHTFIFNHVEKFLKKRVNSLHKISKFIKCLHQLALFVDAKLPIGISELIVFTLLKLAILSCLSSYSSITYLKFTSSSDEESQGTLSWLEEGANIERPPLKKFFPDIHLNFLPIFY